jgi:hypothetical protein
VALGKYSSTAHLTWLSQKTVGDGEKLLTYLNSALKVLLGTDIFPRVPKKKKVKFCCPVLCMVNPTRFGIKFQSKIATHHVAKHNTPIHNILSTAPQLSISQKALGTLPEVGNVMPKYVGATIHN